MSRIDETNLQLLILLQKNCRASLAELAAAVGRSETTVRERIAVLERDGLLRGYHAEVDWARAGLPASVVVQARCDMASVPELTKRLATTPNVTSASLVTGDMPLMVHLQVRDVQHLRDILGRNLAGLVDAEASIVLESLVEQRAPSLSPAVAAVPPREAPGRP